jgi:hypothetical protein
MVHRFLLIFLGLLLSSCACSSGGQRQRSAVKAVAETKGLIAFWDFDHAVGDTWGSYHDADLLAASFPLHLRRIGDPERYTAAEWPYRDADSELVFDGSGPFGHAVRFNQGFVYGAVDRGEFDGTLLDLHGKRPFTIIAWCKFIGTRHMVTGIWDEGGWNRYEGRRQVALFAGLFNQKGAIAHVSATGAASYPQSFENGAQYARLRAIDGQPFENNQWISMAATFNPERGEVVAYLNGEMTSLVLTDPVAQDVYQYPTEQAANPFRFPFPLFSPHAFVLKFNGYDLESSAIREHRLDVDLDAGHLIYHRDSSTASTDATFRILFEVTRGDRSLWEMPIEMEGIQGAQAELPTGFTVLPNDEVKTRLETWRQGQWVQVGTEVRRVIREGAPFTFGRALGLGAEERTHGSQLYLDGVAAFNRVLSLDELKTFSFVEGG